MRRSRSTVLSLPVFSLTAILTITSFFSTATFAAAPDRITGPIAPQQLTKLPAGVPRKALPQYDQGRVSPALPLRYMTLLTVPTSSQQAALDQLLVQQQNPNSPLYHKWLTPEQYADRFGLSPNDIQKLTAWLQSQGFSIVRVARGRNYIVFAGTAAQAEAAFKTEIHNFDINGEKHFSNISSPSVPAALSGIVSGIRGLSNFRPKPNYEIKKPSYSDPVTGGYARYLAPGDIATFYDIQALYTAGINGANQSLAVMGQTDIYLSDITDFRSSSVGFNLPTISGCTADSTTGLLTSCTSPNYLGYVLVNTDPGAPSLGDLPEADLDLEWSGATARNAQIIYVNAPDPNGNGVWDSWYYAVDNNTAPVITLSYTTCELAEVEYGASYPGQEGSFSSDEMELKQANTEGITFMNSSGDHGAAACDPPDDNQNETLATLGVSVNYPSSSPEVTGVGGTMIAYGIQLPNNNYSASNWSNTNSADGGSVSGYIQEDSWNDSVEFGAYCAAGVNTSFCNSYGITNAETAQEAFGFSATGGGPSNCTSADVNDSCTGGFPQPYWQTVVLPNQTAARFVPDVSLLASANWPGYIWCTPQEELSNTSPYDTSTTSSCASGIATAANGVVSGTTYEVYPSIVGGTSASSPIFAGIVTLLNQYVVAHSIQNTPGLGNINPNLYYLAIHNPSAFHQVTAGTDAPGSNQIYCTAFTPSGQPDALLCPDSGILGFLSATVDVDHNTGYNLASGLGSVDVGNLFTAWSASLTPNFVVTMPDVTSTLPSVTPVALNGTLTATHGYTGSVTLTCGTGAPPTCIPPGSAVTPTNAGAAFTVMAGSTTPGSYTFNVSGTDGTRTNTQVVTLQVNQNFTAVAGTPTTANPGQSTSTTILVTPTGASTFAFNVYLACPVYTPLPTGVTCSVSPSVINAGSSAPTSVTVTFQTAGPFTGSAGSIQRGHATRKLTSQKQRLFLPFSLPLAGIVFFGLAGGRMKRRYQIAGLCLALVFAGLLLACGGGNGGGGGSTPVTVTPSTASVQLGATQQFTASSAATWSLGTGSVGSISSSGLYTAPATGTTPASFSVIATPTSGTAGTATVTIPTVGVSVSPLTVTTLYPSISGAPAQTQQFTATVTNSNANEAVTWSVTSGGGTIDANSGLYTAPATSPGSAITVTATSASDSSKTGTSTVTLATPTPAGTTPVAITVTEGTLQQTATVNLTVVN